MIKRDKERESMNQKKIEKLMCDRNPQRDQCIIDLFGDFVEMFLKVFGGDKDEWNYSEDYVYEGVRYLNVTGTIKGDFQQWNEWIQENNITCKMTQEFSDSDFDFYIVENFVNGEFTGDTLDVVCHSEDPDALALLEG